MNTQTLKELSSTTSFRNKADAKQLISNCENAAYIEQNNILWALEYLDINNCIDYEMLTNAKELLEKIEEAKKELYEQLKRI